MSSSLPSSILFMGGKCECRPHRYHAGACGDPGFPRQAHRWLAAVTSIWRKLHRVVHHSEYKSVLPELLDHAEPHFVAFTSGLNSEGRPWCPDCSAAMPIIREVVLGAGGSLLEVSVGTRADWADRQHPMRVDPQCPVRYVPTLYHWSTEGCGSSVSNPLSSDETEENLRLTVAKFVQQTAAGQRYVDRLTREIIQSGGKGCGGC
ncbi:hypothetical protein VOLCADRAFT_107196 [Volvox carteri f. nagariensis]|uniref:Thioredoxin domain-containing protein n=1 Tax=Volvox carteri f. nagariensis TaxID=3068 RepID=D8UCJ2_VOLCA|nr:uncharacterized protein VOLCADRAFT_107196 [Volvox carteri f. nagariensis]EFJ42501.1 hypothetical protein VOLCADRAFT_107196 [Volvox carteri f. nagariensis]|eukprot:XP_002956357.1 hypothetical protein VOLCADRAFT_107196 [Volvox carteri f. nagariensis]